jgi:hypothetical protein
MLPRDVSAHLVVRLSRSSPELRVKLRKLLGLCLTSSSQSSEQILERPLRRTDIFAKCIPIKRRNALVSEAVRCDLMTSLGDREYNFRAVRRQPSKNEECASCSVPLEAAEEGLDTMRYPARAGQPLVAFDDRFKRFDLEVLLDVYCNEVSGRGLL